MPFADGTLVNVPEGLHEEECLLLGDVLPTGLFAAKQAHAIVGSDGIMHGLLNASIVFLFK